MHAAASCIQDTPQLRGLAAYDMRAQLCDRAGQHREQLVQWADAELRAQLGLHPTLAALHPNSARVAPDEDGLLPEWVAYHSLVATARVFLVKVVPPWELAGLMQDVMVHACSHACSAASTFAQMQATARSLATLQSSAAGKSTQSC